MHFDVETLYELHYQMITLGKVSTCQAGLIKQRCQALRTGSSQSMPCSIRLGPPSPLTLAAYPGTVITEQSTMLNRLSILDRWPRGHAGVLH